MLLEKLFKQPKKTHIIALCSLVFLALIGASLYHVNKPKRPPNVILLVLDSLRRDYLGTYGFQGDITPFIDKLAGQSVVFENAYAPAPWTKPSVASLFTSLYPTTAGITGQTGITKQSRAVDKITETDILTPENVTMAEIFQQAGYHTLGVVENAWLREEFGFSQGFKDYHALTSFIEKPKGIWDTLISATNQLPPKKPLFLYVHAMDVHTPYRSSLSFLNLLKDSPSLGKDSQISEETLEKVETEVQAIDIPFPHSKKHNPRAWRAVYAAAVRRLDDKLEEIFQVLEDRGLTQNAIVILTSDHGEAFFEHGDWLHGRSLYAELVNIPLIVHFPNQTQQNRPTSPITLVDVLPNLLDWAGIETSTTAFQGKKVSLNSEESQTVVFFEGVANSPEQRGLISQNQKYILDPEFGQEVLFDLKKNPEETENLLSQRPEEAKKLNTILLEHKKRISENQLEPQKTAISEETIENLKALGYF